MKRIRFVTRYLKGYKRHLVVMIVATAIYVGIILINPLVLQFLIDNVIGNDPITNPFIQQISKSLGGVDAIRQSLLGIGIVIVSLNLLSSMSLFFRSYSNGLITETFNQRVRNHLYDHLQNVPYAYHVTSKTGDLIQRCISDVDTISRFLNNQIKELIYASFMVVISLTIMFNIHVKMTLIAMAVFPVIFIFGFIFFKRMQTIFKEVDESEAALSNVFKESLDAVRVVKAFNRERYELERFEKQNRSYKKLVEDMIQQLGIYWGVSDTICILQILVVIIVSVYEVNSGSLSVGNAIVFVSYISTVLWPIRNVGRIISDMGKLSVSVDRLQEIVDVPVEDLESGEKPNLIGDIVFNNVSFGYEDSPAILKDLNFTIKAGETVAIMGPTGSGKSSIVHLLTRLYDVTQGTITLNGFPINEVARGYLRDHIGMVLQEPYLFSKTIYDNIKLSAPHASDKDVYEAAKIAAVHDVIESFDQGYLTAVGEKGVTLSGGQKQRVAIARTVIAKKPIVIFDDSLSALDTETDSMIRKALKEKVKDATTILITHRVNSAQQADKILVIDQGRLVQMGTHESLIAEEGIYKKTADIQNSGRRGDHYES